ncbi:MAG: hypothetical protein ACM3X6_14050 [Patescibacteria group bacterium]
MNGKPGDDPLLDILAYKRRVFSEQADALIIEIERLGGHKELEKIDLLNPPDRKTLEERLVGIRDRLKKEAREGGWELDEDERG